MKFLSLCAALVCVSLVCVSLVCVSLVLGSPAWAQRQQQLQLDRTNAKRTTVGALTFLGAVVISPGPFRVGGLSGLFYEKGPSGEDQLVAVADNGRLHRASLQWAAGRLVGAAFTPGQLLRDVDGSLPKSRARYDAEALVRLQQGDWLVAYERDHRIVRFADGGGVPTGVPAIFPAIPGIMAYDRNAGIESLAELADGRVLAIAESRAEGWFHPAWLWQDGHWSLLNYLSAPGLSPSDVAALPNGDVLVLERGFSFLYGFRNRIVQVAASSLKADARAEGKELARLESPIITENFEGLAVEPLPNGRVRLFIVSDNNFIAAQETILAAFEFTPSF